MEYIEYLEQSAKTLSEPSIDRFPACGGMNTLHAVIGITSEISELIEGIMQYDVLSSDITNLYEEFGDLLWYMAILEREYEGINAFNRLSGSYMCNIINACGFVDESSYIACFNTSSGELLDCYKKMVFYGKEHPDMGFSGHLEHIMLILMSSTISLLYQLDIAERDEKGDIIDECHITESESATIVSKAMEANINKLKKRYPQGKFDSDDQANRDVDGEHGILEDSLK